MKQLEQTEFCRGTVDDAAELAEFAARTFSEAFAADTSAQDLQAHLEGSFGARQQSAELADRTVTTILARSSGVLIAYAQIRQSPPPPCVTDAAPIELHRFYLDRRAHGTGLASSLMQQVHHAARDLGGSHIWLGVWEKNARAIAFYTKAKFVEVGRQFYIVGSDKQLDRVLVTRVAAKDPSVQAGPPRLA
jgi:ribosomal protein S18 acetylase RimI-like enzyme